jgi:8-amino-7-oxononanoate synthase
MEGPVGARTVFNGIEYDYFSGTGYLGLQNHPEVVRAAQDAIQKYGLSTGTSRGGYGEHPLFDQLEVEIRAFFGVSGCLYFSSGYLGNIILTQGLTNEYERFFIDSSSHFSVFDGARSGGKPLHLFAHLDAGDLRHQIEKYLNPGERPLIYTDGVFPISGETAPIPEYLEIAERHNGRVCLDDAHAAGVLGSNGRGTLEKFGISSPRCIGAATLSKALGGFGGIITGTTEQINELEKNSKVTVAASPPPLAAVAASAAALRIARTQPELREMLRRNVLHCRQGLRELGWEMEESTVPILCLRVRAGMDLVKIRDGLFKQRIAVAHVKTYSSTPEGGALRIAIFATHTEIQIERLLTCIKQLI